MTSDHSTWWTATANVLGICALAFVVAAATDSLAFVVGLLAACVVIVVELLAVYQEVRHFDGQ